jgi:hypothetical protein
MDSCGVRHRSEGIEAWLPRGSREQFVKNSTTRILRDRAKRRGHAFVPMLFGLIRLSKRTRSELAGAANWAEIEEPA